jgi:non-specific serine/threonine protein kinase
MALDFDKYDIVLTTYDRVRLDIELLKDIQFHTLILDEAQAIKNIQAGRTAAVRKLKSIFTISLTGTPIENHIGEYYSIIDVAVPGLLPDYKLFMKCVQQGEYDHLIKKTRAFVLRRTKDKILKELPPKVESNIVLDMSEKQEKVYATTVAEVKRLIDRAYETKTTGQASIIALTAILRLRQICISPQMIDCKANCNSPKIEYLVESLDDIIQEGNAALVFSQFTVCLDLIQKAFDAAGLAYFRIDGDTPMTKRKQIVEDFQNSRKQDGEKQNDKKNVSILLLSLKTGGVGLNLTRANYVFHVDPWWNPSVENQASDRAHRIGQTNTVFITRLVMHHTIEEKMMALKEEKMKLFQDIMEYAENKTRGMITKKDFDLLLG